jgi:hypothetical protein
MKTQRDYLKPAASGLQPRLAARPAQQQTDQFTLF